MSDPVAASRSCRDCQTWMFEDGKDRLSPKVAQRAGQPLRRPAGVPTPCQICPKQSPERAAEFELSPKNMATLSLYYEAKATAGASLGDAIDPMLSKNLGIIEMVMKTHERAQHQAVLAGLHVAAAARQ